MFEDEALRLGADLAKAERQVDAIKSRIVDGVDKARGVRLPITHYAKLTRINRQELYRLARRKINAEVPER